MDFQFEKNSLLKIGEVIKTTESLIPYIVELQETLNSQSYKKPEGFINLPFDESSFKEVASLKEKVANSHVKYILNIGMGGSNLGTEAIYNAIYGHFDLIEPERFPKIVFLDNVSPEFLTHLEFFARDRITKPQDVIINAVSKSGKTTEVLENLEIIESFLPWARERTVVVTGKNSELWDQALVNNMERLSLPDMVGGRYSVFSAVGLFPLACAGIDIYKLADGAMGITEKCVDNMPDNNIAALSASVLYKKALEGKDIHVSFFFNPELEHLGKWYSQLTAESLGKTEIKGITPIVSVGTSDLHSMLQLYMGGPKDKFTTFISSQHSKAVVKVPESLSLPGVSEQMEIKGKSAKEIIDSILEGVKKSYVNKLLPFAEISLDDISEKSLGEFMQFKMIEMVYLAKLFDVDAFNQPDVEEYKEETRELLEDL